MEKFFIEPRPVFSFMQTLREITEAARVRLADMTNWPGLMICKKTESWIGKSESRTKGLLSSHDIDKSD